MKITYFRIKGYIKVLNGMGLDEVIIPFNTFKNRIILIQGENGCSKSTILAALTPNPDSSDEFRTDVFIDEYGNRQIIEYPAEKEIHYTDLDENGSVNIYKILIQSIVDESRTRRTTKAFISKNGEEMNPNGNVSSFKEIRDSILGIDPIYLDLSSISAENRGIVDMIPSERRKYMAAYIGSLDTYNNIFKTISKKVSNLKSYINTLQNKIYEIGDENELRLKQLQLETQLKEYNKNRDELLKNLAEAESIVKIVDPDNKMQDLYTSISERLQTLKSEMEKNQSKRVRLYSILNIKSENENLIELLSKTEELLNSYTSSLDEKKNKITTLIALNSTTSSQLESDRAMLSGLQTNTIQDNIIEAVDNISQEIDVYEQYLSEEDIKRIKYVSISELEDFRDSFILFIENIKAIEEIYNDNIFSLALQYFATDYIKTTNEKELNLSINNLRESIKSKELQLFQNKNSIESITHNIEELENFKDVRPKDCTIDSCYYIKKYIDIKNSENEIRNNLKILQEENIRLESEIESEKEDIGNLNSILEDLRAINTSYALLEAKKNIIKKLGNFAKLNDKKALASKLKSYYRYTQEIDEISQLIEKSHIYNRLVDLRSQLKDLEADLKVYKNNKSLMETLTISISKNEENYNKREDEIKQLSKDCTFLTGVIEETNQKVLNLKDLISEEETKQSLEIEKENLRKEFDSVRDKIKLVKEKVDSVNDLKNTISNIENSIEPLRETINQIKFSLTNIVSYQQELKDSNDKYDKMVFIRNACSPGNGMGIQSEYIKRYMNDIIIHCNQVLQYMFGGTIQLDVPIINEKQFSIPFIGPNGIPVPDISNGSTAQKCMIGLVFSCVAMMKSSTKYNIPRFDEIDGGLDQQNRVTFIQILNQVLDFMNSEQAIIISHNSEFSTENTSKIFCTHRGFTIEA